MYDKFVDIDCFKCNKQLHDLKIIYIGVEDDRYYCERCRDEYNILCRNLNDVLEEWNGW